MAALLLARPPKSSLDVKRLSPQPVRPMPTCQEALPLLWVQCGTRSRQQRAEDAAKVLVHLAPGGFQCLSLLLIQLSNDLQDDTRMTIWQCLPPGFLAAGGELQVARC